ncbi:MAG: hypothetical protein M3139_07130 [Bacteroidota bacterium]|nr:hypothetical protein [Bacteroidota bacterium]
MKDEFINKKVEDAMASLDGMQGARPRPFLFTRLEARMQNDRNVWSKLSSFVARPIIAFACVCFVLIINAMVIFLSNTSGKPAAQQGSELATADEYSQVSQVSYNLYDLENSKP